MSNLSEIERFVIDRKPEGLIVDTNIFLLLLVGIYDPNFISLCRLTKQYNIDDFELLKRILALFKKIVITPHILAEISNVSIARLKNHPENLYPYFQSAVNFLKSTTPDEHYLSLSSLLIVDIKTIADFGFSDISIFELAKQTQIPILTDDTSFYAFSATEIPIFKFEHIKFAQVLAS